jgi:ribose transport system ATP-binding protein
MSNPSASNVPLLEMEGIVKRFPGVVALSGVSLKLHAGEVLALMGENGAGKSTLMKVLGGATAPDEGQIKIDGQPIHLRSVADAKKLGIALIHQELMLAPNLSIADNIFLGGERHGWGPLFKLRQREMNQVARQLLQRVGLNLPSTAAVSTLTAGQMQMVEIAKALSLRARMIIMDEPTSSLTLGESEQLFSIIHQLKKEGIGIIYISHRLEEVLHLADRITVLRDGKNVGDVSAKNATHDGVVSMMVGRQYMHRFPDRLDELSSDESLVVDDLRVPGAPFGVTFSAKRGEVLGFAGLVGAGRTELMECIFGVTPPLSGRMLLDGQKYLPHRPSDAIARGIYLAPEDRKRHGVVLPMTIAQNMSLPDVNHYAPLGFLNRKRERQVADIEVKRMAIRTPSIFQKVVNLSGGNQQKVVLGKWLAMRPKILILDEPTRGIDVGAKAEIYNQIAKLAASGITILMVSSDMEEILGMSDRVVVMHERAIAGIVPRKQLSEERVASLMAGKMTA